jgi:hypothetical protein
MSFSLLFMILTTIQAPSKNYEAVVFESFTRGGSISITITADSIQCKDNGVVTSFALKPADWKALCATLNKIAINQLGDYPAPTSNRAMDAAWHSTIVVKMNGKDYSTTTFDNRIAPEKVRSLMNSISHLEKDYFKKK